MIHIICELPFIVGQSSEYAIMYLLGSILCNSISAFEVFTKITIEKLYAPLIAIIINKPTNLFVYVYGIEVEPLYVYSRWFTHFSGGNEQKV